MTAAQQAPANAVAPIDEVESNLKGMEEKFKNALPPQIKPEKFLRVVMTAIQRQGDLLLAVRQTLYNECLLCAQDGLIPDGREAALVVYNMNVAGKNQPARYEKRVKYMPMISGILKKIRNSGELAMIHSDVVHKNDKFKYWTNTDGVHLEHEPLIEGDRGAKIGVFGFAKMKDGSIYADFMTVEEVEKVRSVSRAKDAGPWKDWWDGMAEKTVLKRMSKRMPMSTDIEEFLHRDDELNDFDTETRNVTDSTRSTRLAKAMGLGETEEAVPDFSGDNFDPPAGAEGN